MPSSNQLVSLSIREPLQRMWPIRLVYLERLCTATSARRNRIRSITHRDWACVDPYLQRLVLILFKIKYLILNIHLLMEYPDNEYPFVSMAIKNRVPLVIVTTYAGRDLRALMTYKQRTREELKRLF